MAPYDWADILFIATTLAVSVGGISVLLFAI
jgi:hypothetical protein